MIYYCESCQIELDLTRAAAKVGVQLCPLGYAEQRRGYQQWTPLDGQQLSVLLEHLNLQDIFLIGSRAKQALAGTEHWHAAYHECFCRMWNGWKEIFLDLSTTQEWSGDANSNKRGALQEKLNRVGQQMVDAFGEGFITCYTHIIISHSVDMLVKWGNIKRYSCSAQELYNAELNHQLWGHSRPRQSSLDAIQREHRVLIAKEQGVAVSALQGKKVQRRKKAIRQKSNFIHPSTTKSTYKNRKACGWEMLPRK